MSRTPSLQSIRSRMRAGDKRRAERDARALLERNPAQPEVLYLLGCLRQERGHLSDAIAHFERAVALAPERPELLEAMARACLQNGDLDAAERAARQAEHHAPEQASIQNLLGLVALERGDLESAVQRFSRSAALEMNLDAVTNMAVALNRTGDWAAAEEWARSALRIAPKSKAAWINLGLALKALRRLDEAKEAFRSAGADRRARFNLGYTLMLEGAIGEGLPLLESRKALLGIGRGLARPEWDGQPSPKRTLLVVHEQGLGDTLLMCRFWPALLERCGRVVALVQPPLARLMAASFPGVEVVTSLDGVRFDAWCPTMSLPLRLGIDAVEKIPLTPWITLPDPPPDPPPTAHDEPLRIGLNWAGNPKFTFDAVRSTHLPSIALLLQAPNVRWVSLHRGHLEHEAEEAGLAQPLRDSEDFLDTARVIRRLDMVVSTETAIPNLSAAMGVPTCVLASPDWDWRWAHWYDRVTVCWQDRAGEWMPACIRALEAIRDEMEHRALRTNRAA